MSTRQYARLTRLPDRSFFLLGIRGVGKSTWARRVLPDAYVVDLLDERRYQELLVDPSLFAAELRSLPSGSWVVLDEVQRLPGLLNEVHRLIEERGLRFALLGSSARKLKTAGTNLLAGRATRKAMHPLTPTEMGGDFDLGATLRHGSIPLVVAASDRRAVLESYVQLYLREEIRAEALVRNLPGFARFLPVAGLFHGQVVNVAGLARDAGVARTTVEGYLGILEDTLLTVRLPAFEARLRVRERKHPKLYWVDPGVVRAVKRQLGPVAAEEKGPLLEGWILQFLRAHAEEMSLFEEVFYWAPMESTGGEVDFLLRRGREYLAIEVKSQKRFSPAMTSGLRAVEGLKGLTRRVLVYGGPRALRTEVGIDVWPFSRLAEAVSQDKLWP
jgi:predicted AAA+ superfamily ATPase